MKTFFKVFMAGFSGLASSVNARSYIVNDGGFAADRKALRSDYNRVASGFSEGYLKHCKQARSSQGK